MVEERSRPRHAMYEFLLSIFDVHVIASVT